jgi:protease I
VDGTLYDVLVIPGGTINADNLRTEKSAVALVKALADAGKTVVDAAK